MPDYRHHAPSVDLFTDDEHLVLCDWFGVDYPRSERWIDDILDEWNIPYEIPEHRRIDAAVAQILLERVQDDLPNWTAGVGDRFVVARPILDRRAVRKVELWPRHLMTINWADRGPGFSWPVAYKATYVPGFSRLPGDVRGRFATSRLTLSGRTCRSFTVAPTSSCPTGLHSATTPNRAGHICSTPGSSAKRMRMLGLTKCGSIKATKKTRTTTQRLTSLRQANLSCAIAVVALHPSAGNRTSPEPCCPTWLTMVDLPDAAGQRSTAGAGIAMIRTNVCLAAAPHRR